MNGDKEIDGQGHCEEHRCWYEDTRGCPKCYPKRYPERYPQPNLPNPPTDPKRPMIGYNHLDLIEDSRLEKMRKRATGFSPLDFFVHDLVRHARALEGKLKAVTEERDIFKSADYDALNSKADSLLAGLVKEGRGLKADVFGGPFWTALIAAEQYFKAAKTVLERKKGE